MCTSVNRSGAATFSPSPRRAAAACPGPMSPPLPAACASKLTMNTASASTRLTKRPVARLSSASRPSSRHSRRRTPLPAILSTCGHVALPVRFDARGGWVVDFRRSAPAGDSAVHGAHCARAMRRDAARKGAIRRRNMANRWQLRPGPARAGTALRYSRRSSTPCASIEDRRHEPPHRHRRGRTRDPRQLRGGAAPARLRGRDVRQPRRGAGRVSHAAAGPRAGRHRPGRRRRRRLRADPRIARAVGDAADHLPVGARQRFRRRRRTAPGRRRLPDQGREPAASRRAHRRAVPPQRAAVRAAGRARTSSSAGRSRST